MTQTAPPAESPEARSARARPGRKPLPRERKRCIDLHLLLLPKEHEYLQAALRKLNQGDTRISCGKFVRLALLERVKSVLS